MSCPGLILHLSVLRDVMPYLSVREYNLFIRRFSSDEDEKKTKSAPVDAEDPPQSKKRNTVSVPDVVPDTQPRGRTVEKVASSEVDFRVTVSRFPIPTSATDSLPCVTDEEVIDSHFHLDRVCKKRGMSTLDWDAVQKLVQDKKIPRPSGAVTNFCDPERYPSEEEVSHLYRQRVRVCVGIHPKKTLSFSHRDFFRLRTLTSLPEVTGVGEVGLDFTTPSHTWPIQRDVLSQVLELPLKDKVLVLHCRGRSGTGDDAYTSLLYQMKGLVRRKQMIHLHCFNGSEDLIRRWREVFPNTYFGFTPLVKSFRPDQLKALRTLEINRILLETDAPYFTPPGMDVSTPACISYTAKAVADARQEDWREVLSRASRTAATLYKM